MIKQIALGLVGVVGLSTAAYVTSNDPAATCTAPPSLDERMTRLANSTGNGVHLFTQPVEPEKVKDVTLGTWHTLGGWTHAFSAAANGHPVATAPAVPCTPDPEKCDTPASVQASLSTRSSRFSAEQIRIAQTAQQIQVQRGLPRQALIVILATGFGESGVRNLDYGDRDSIGWLQQRGNWGSVKQRMSPAYQAGKFYDALVKVHGWQHMPVTRIAHRVQVNAYPNAYAKYEDDAKTLAASLGTPQPDPPSSLACADPASHDGGPVPAEFNKQGNPRTVEAALGWYAQHMPNGNGVPVQGKCERWVTLAYGWPGGYPTAIAHWNAPGPRSDGTDVPPRGALVFWRTGNPAGHVAISTGNGNIISTDYNSRTHRYQAGMVSEGPISDIDRWGPRLGYRAPAFRGERA